MSLHRQRSGVPGHVEPNSVRPSLSAMEDRLRLCQAPDWQSDPSEPFLSTMNNLHQHFPELREFMYKKNVGPDVWWSRVNHNYCRNWYPWSTNGRDNGPYCFVHSDRRARQPAMDHSGVMRHPVLRRKAGRLYVHHARQQRAVRLHDPAAVHQQHGRHTVRFSIRTWTVEYPLHARFKFADDTSILQRGYYFYVGPLDTVASRIVPMLQNGKFIKWRQYSPNKTMAVEWRNIYFRFNGGTRTVEFGDVLDTVYLSRSCSLTTSTFVAPQFASFRASLEGDAVLPAHYYQRHLQNTR